MCASVFFLRSGSLSCGVCVCVILQESFVAGSSPQFSSLSLSLSLLSLCWCSSVPLRARNSTYFIVVVLFFLSTNKHLIVSFFIF